MRETLTNAIALAVEAHRGQTDKAGEPYILHPLRVMLAVQGEVERIAAVLHDVIEDRPKSLSFDDIALMFGADVWHAVDALTRRKGEHYFDYVRRAAAHPVARDVKIADVTDNLRWSGDPKEKSRREKYYKALAILIPTTSDRTRSRP